MTLKANVQFYADGNARVVDGSGALDVSFEPGDEARMILFLPQVQEVLPEVLAERAGTRMRWSDLRKLLEARGVKLQEP